MVDFYSQFNPSPLSIKQFIDFGKYGSPRPIITVLIDTERIDVLSMPCVYCNMIVNHVSCNINIVLIIRKVEAMKTI